ncbi:uncharacterized protein LOC143210212 [Lasioglossum baleicum]|uniref:uncharacterized protein LOC143210212 n=1 Tax=Lasioglossum baleicum TaxID=434251 RepID=UPI003FCDB02D
MNSVIAIACLLSVVTVGADIIDVYLESTKDKFMPCARENGYTEDNLRTIFDKDTALGVDGSTCQRACTMKALGMMENSKLVPQSLDVFIKTVHADDPEKIRVLQKAAAECLEKAEPMTDECKIAYVFVECFLSKH